MQNLTKLNTFEESLLKILKEKEGPVSGEKLAQLFGISRVSIWKKIKKLKNLGYPISIHKKGYELSYKDIFLQEDLENLLKATEYFKEVVYLLETTSTMDVAKNLAEAGKKAIVIAERQSQGKGRLGRKWESHEGGLWITLILQESLPLRKAHFLTYLSSVAIALAIRETFNLPAKVKWPNDVLLYDKKVAGILLEIKAEVDRLLYALIGMGINVNNKVEGKAFLFPATSICENLKSQVKRLPLFKNILKHFEELLQNKERILPMWKEFSCTLGKMVRVETTDRTIIGWALDLDDQGALLIKTLEGSIEKIYSGDCFHLRNFNI
ncbi:MAG: biotin--[acetyl-CoA-carboxylase] ligase [Caldimicrobium sp.]